VTVQKPAIGKTQPHPAVAKIAAHPITKHTIAHARPVVITHQTATMLAKSPEHLLHPTAVNTATPAIHVIIRTLVIAAIPGIDATHATISLHTEISVINHAEHHHPTPEHQPITEGSRHLAAVPRIVMIGEK